MIKELRHFALPIAVTIFGIAVAVVLAILIFQVITADKPAARLLPETSDASAKAETPAVATVPEAETANTPQTESQTPTTATVKPQPKPTSKPQQSQPTPAPQPTSTYPVTTTGTPETNVTVSNGGCTIKAIGKPGTIVKIAAHNASKGGETSYTIPSSGTITVGPGGMLQGMDIDIWLITPVAIPGTQYGAGSILVYAGDTITNTAGCSS